MDTAITNHHHQQKQQHRQDEKRHCSIFEVPAEFFDSCRLLQSPSSSLIIPNDVVRDDNDESENDKEENLGSQNSENNHNNSMQRWRYSTCKTEFKSLQDQCSHFKSDIHRLNIKLSIAGKGAVKEEYFDETTPDTL